MSAPKKLFLITSNTANEFGCYSRTHRHMWKYEVKELRSQGQFTVKEAS
jgi:hypothetical protein